MSKIYWTTTIIISAFLLLSSYTYFFSKTTIEGLKELGFPNFFRIQLGILKLIAAILLIVPNIPIILKEWSYAGVSLFFITALVAHIAHKDSIFITMLLFILIAIHAMSYHYYHKNIVNI